MVNNLDLIGQRFGGKSVAHEEWQEHRNFQIRNKPGATVVCDGDRVNKKFMIYS